MDDTPLVQRCQSGDAAAFDSLYQQYARKVYHTAFLITGDRAVAEEVMQEAFATTFRTIGSLKAPGAFSAWLYKLVIRRARRAGAREQAEHHLPVPAAEPVSDHQDRSVQRRILWDAIATLPTNLRIALVFYYYHDKPIAEIGALMDVPEGTVKSWLYRARGMLGRELGDPAAQDGGEHDAGR